MEQLLIEKLQRLKTDLGINEKVSYSKLGNDYRYLLLNDLIELSRDKKDLMYTKGEGNNYYTDYGFTYVIEGGSISKAAISERFSRIDDILLSYEFTNIYLSARHIYSSNKLTKLLDVMREFNWVPCEFVDNRLVLKKLFEC